ncbi:MAG: SPOR domain-containing protein, partial [Flavobacteriia bacterium]
LSFRIGQTIAQFNSLPQPTTVNATNWFFQYSGSYFKNRLNQSISFGRNTTISPFNNQLNTSSFISSSSSIQSKAGYGITLSGSYLQNEIITNTAVNNLTTIPVNLQFSIPRGSKFFSLPSFYYVFTDDGLGKLNNGGVNIGFSHYDYEKNVRASANFMGGYNFYTDSVQYKPLFNANAFAMIGWRTLSVSIRYMYGPMGLAGIRSFLKYDSRYPQYIFNSVNYQYVFKQTRFVGEISLNHSWNNQTWANNIFVAPNMYFFTKNGWRFNVLVSYGLNTRNNERAVEFYQYQGYQNVPDPEERMSYTSNFNLSVGLRKQFGIPIPKKFRKVQYVNANFVAFLDFNGNKIMDNEEVPLENIVIKVNGHEVLTDKDGKGKFVNIPCGTYEHKIIPLVDLDGWFTYTMDSIDIVGEQYYVPFTRGVKVSGSVVLDREKFTKDVLATLDLSGIKIFTTDTLGNSMATMTDFNGNFSFYVPYGAYILSMDEEVIGDRFYIAQNHIPMDLYDGMDGFYQSFFIIEKRRTVKKKKFNEKGELIMVEEVDGGADRNTNNTTINNYEDSTVIHNNNTEYNIFNEERKGDNNGGGTNVNADELYRELDERIDRLDAIIRALLKGEITEDNRKVLAEALRQLKNEEEAKRLNGTNPQPVEGTIDLSRHFHLVVGGFVYRENAERFVAKLKAQGFNEAVIIGVFNGYFLVRLKDYATLQEAIDAQQKYKFIVDGIWVHKWP